MFYFVIAPIALLIAVLGLLAIALLLLRRRLAADPVAPVPALLFWVAQIQIAVALAAIHFTQERSISSQACLTGIFGVPVFLAVGAGSLIACVAWLWGDRAPAKDLLRRYWGYLTAVFITQAYVILVLTRSALLCTV